MISLFEIHKSNSVTIILDFAELSDVLDSIVVYFSFQILILLEYKIILHL